MDIHPHEHNRVVVPPPPPTALGIQEVAQEVVTLLRSHPHLIRPEVAYDNSKTQMKGHGGLPRRLPEPPESIVLPSSPGPPQYERI